MNRLRRLSCIALGFLIGVAGCGGKASKERTDMVPNPAKSIHDFTLKDIEGRDVDLARYKGQVVMIVNVASKCGFTRQYEGLQKLYETYRDKGFVILGFPANNFLRQEPGTNEQIKAFCTTKYNVTFPMFAKVSVKGSDQDPLYAFLTDKHANPTVDGKISWNFNKFLIGRDGRIIKQFGSRVKPQSEELIRAIEAALGEKA